MKRLFANDSLDKRIKAGGIDDEALAFTQSPPSHGSAFCFRFRNRLASRRPRIVWIVNGTNWNK
jgi:hypothetical protein